MEENLSLPELEAVLTAHREQKQQDRKFAAALKGIDLDKDNSSESTEDAFERVKRRAEAKASGKSEGEVEFSELGFGFEEI